MLRSGRLLLALVASLPPVVHAQVENVRYFSDGYGYLLEVRGEELHVYERRALGALPTGIGRRTGVTTFELDGETWRLAGAGETDCALTSRLAVFSPRWLDPVFLRRTEMEPEPPTDRQRVDPRFNLEWFLSTFDELYPFFEQRDPNWWERRFAARERVEEFTGDGELMEVFADLIAPLRDPHVRVEGAGLAARSFESATDPRFLDRFRFRVDRRLDPPSIGWGLRAALTFGRLGGEVGYLRFDAFGAGEGAEPIDARRYLRELDEALAFSLGDSTRPVRGLVVDLRFAREGEHELALAALSRFLPWNTTVANKYVRKQWDDPLQRTSIHARVSAGSGSAYSRPVAVLTSRFTSGAAEVFGLGFLQRDAPTVSIGEPTAGALSPVLETRLPNGWTLALGTEVLITPQAMCYEAFGLPLDRHVPTLQERELGRGDDPALDAALRWVRATAPPVGPAPRSAPAR